MTVVPCAAAQSLQLAGAEIGDSAGLARAVSRIANELRTSYRNPASADSLDQIFRIEMVMGDHADAERHIKALRALRQRGQRVSTVQSRATNLQYEVLARASSLASPGGPTFAESFSKEFRRTVGSLDDRTSALAMREFDADPAAVSGSLQRIIGFQRGKSEISRADAIQLVRAYQIAAAYREMAPLVGPLIVEDDARRYEIDRNVLVKTPDGASVCALVVRPRTKSARLPALLNFTIYADSVNPMNEARRTASNGYVAVEGFTRGKACSRDDTIPYEHDGADADAVIDWISRQIWSDGRVGMYGGSYEGFTQWAAAKHRTQALKAMMPSVAAAPGIDVPMEGNVFQTFDYYWPLYAASNRTLDEQALNDRARWWRMQRAWYVSGSAYRALPGIDGAPNPIFSRWLDHPSYDSYWRGMVPYGDEFAKINIPVLTTTGYYDGGEIGALYYLQEHYKHDPSAEHYLVVGPYDHVRGQRGTTSSLGDEFNFLDGYELDPVAHIDLGELRYQWFDYVLKHGPKPQLLRDRINYEVMGANEWRHAPSLAAMHNQTVPLYLDGTYSARGFHSLSPSARPDTESVVLTVDLADRRDIDSIVPGGTFSDTVDVSNGVAFVSAPLPKVTEVSGFFTGHLDFVTNKRDFDFEISLYEITEAGKCLALTYYMSRASYVRDRGERNLLKPGARGTLDFTSGGLTSRRLQRGSRLLVVVSIIKQPGAQINYGTGKDVSDEVVADAGAPLSVRWFAQSFIAIPVRRP